jgi:RloB-like protein
MRDRQPKHRQMRAEQRVLARRKESRAGLPAIIVVCEGRKTEPQYIRGLCEAKRINLANVNLVAGDNETDALSLVRKAQTHFRADNDYDAVFVVCDDDGAPLESACQQARRITSGI